MSSSSASDREFGWRDRNILGRVGVRSGPRARRDPVSEGEIPTRVAPLRLRTIRSGLLDQRAGLGQYLLLGQRLVEGTVRGHRLADEQRDRGSMPRLDL